MKASKPSISLLEMLDLLPGAVTVLAAGIWAALTGPFRGEKDAPTYHLHIAYAVMRKCTERYSVAQMEWAQPHTNEVYEQYARKAGFSPDTVQLPHGAMGHWIGDKNAKNVLIWYHGANYPLRRP